MSSMSSAEFSLMIYLGSLSDIMFLLIYELSSFIFSEVAMQD